MNNAKKFLKVSTALGVIFSCGAILSTTINNSFKNVSAASTAIESKQYTEADFAGETLESDDCLVASITQGTSTDTANSFTVTFRSQTLTGLQNAKSNYVIRIDDDNFTGDDDSPAVEGHNRYNDDNLPIFNGTVVYVLSPGNVSPKNETKKKDALYIPSTFIKDGKYSIDVTAIESGAISSAGDPSFDNKNVWVKPGKEENEIKNIFIPDSIKTCKAGAFKDVPSDVTFHFQGESVPVGFETDWASSITNDRIKFNAQFSTTNLTQKSAGGTVKLPDELNRPIDYILGYRANDDYKSDDYNQPLVVEYKIQTVENEIVKSTKTVFEELPIQSSNNPYDSVGKTFDSYTVELTIPVSKNESVDENSIVFHNIYRAYRPDPKKKLTIDLTKPLFVKAVKNFLEVEPLSNLVNLKPTRISKFMGYSVFALTMDLNFDIVSEQFPDPHSLYLDVKTPIYNQNLSKIKKGITSIRYSIITLYKTSFYFEYVGENGQPKSILTHVETAIDNQVLGSKKGNAVSLLVKDSEIAPDFDSFKVTKFEIRDLYLQMDLVTISDSGSLSKLAKSEISFRFGNVEIFNKELKTLPAIFDCNLFLIIFYASYIVLYVGAAYALYRVLKEKFKNDEFRRVNGKKFFKTAALGFGGLAVVLAAILSIIGRTSVFYNSIVVFNPTDPFVIILSIFAAIFIGYFIVNIVKLVKAEMERKQSIRLKLNEDKAEDGTN